MASRNFFPLRGALEREVCSLFGVITFGAAGAPTLTRGLGISSITRDSTGLYTVVITDEFYRLLGASLAKLEASPTGNSWGLKSKSLSTKTFVIQFTNESDAAVDPASGDELYMKLELSNTSAPR